MKPIIIRELKDRRTSLIAYCGIVVVLLLIYIALFPSIKASLDQFQKIYESYPKSFYQAMGIQDLSINTLANYLSIEMYNIMWQLLALLLASSLAGYAIAGQIDKGTIGYYLAMPISRVKLFFSKYFGGVLALLIFVLVSVAGSIPLAALFNNYMPKMGVINLSILSMFFAWAVYAVALFFSALFSEKSKVYMTMGGLLILMYAMNIIATLKGSLAWLDNFSIFHYYNAQGLLSGGSLQLSSIMLFAALIGIFTLLGAFVFKRRDVSV